jgi:hypothetical protein
MSEQLYRQKHHDMNKRYSVAKAIELGWLVPVVPDYEAGCEASRDMTIQDVVRWMRLHKLTVIEIDIDGKDDGRITTVGERISGGSDE